MQHKFNLGHLARSCIRLVQGLLIRENKVKEGGEYFLAGRNNVMHTSCANAHYKGNSVCKKLMTKT